MVLASVLNCQEVIVTEVKEIKHCFKKWTRNFLISTFLNKSSVKNYQERKIMFYLCNRSISAIVRLTKLWEKINAANWKN